MISKIIFPAEWYPQSGVMLTWPDDATDWAPRLTTVTKCFINIAREIARREMLLIVCSNAAVVRNQLTDIDLNRVSFREIPINDTWARDHGGITVFDNRQPIIYDFVFNGWGMKFAANRDNLITRRLFASHAFSDDVMYKNLQPFVLEGGSVESDGNGTLLTTSSCLQGLNRNESMSRSELERYLKRVFGLDRILWLESGSLIGDDTDGHIDTLARFCSPDTITYVHCSDENDEHFGVLKLMENELKKFRQSSGEPYNLVPLPMADKIIDEGQRLPATYANFLIINDAVLMPFYGSQKDELARQILQEVFQDREVIGIDCRPLVWQHGSLHCVTMQFPKGVIK